jgi:hypothetical protein
MTQRRIVGLGNEWRAIDEHLSEADQVLSRTISKLPVKPAAVA